MAQAANSAKSVGWPEYGLGRIEEWLSKDLYEFRVSQATYLEALWWKLVVPWDVCQAIMACHHDKD